MIYNKFFMYFFKILKNAHFWYFSVHAWTLKWTLFECIPWKFFTLLLNEPAVDLHLKAMQLAALYYLSSAPQNGYETRSKAVKAVANQIRNGSKVHRKIFLRAKIRSFLFMRWTVCNSSKTQGHPSWVPNTMYGPYRNGLAFRFNKIIDCGLSSRNIGRPQGSPLRASCPNIPSSPHPLQPRLRVIINIRLVLVVFHT